MSSAGLINLVKTRIAHIGLIIAASVWIAGGIFMAGAAQAAGSGTLTLTPASGTYTVGQAIVVSVYANTGGAPINAVEADVAYPQQKLQFESLDTSASAFSIAAAGSGSGGTVQVARGNIQPVTGRVLVAVINFKVIAAGSAALHFLASSALVTSTDNTNALGSTSGAAYTLTQTQPARHFQGFRFRLYF